MRNFLVVAGLLLQSLVVRAQSTPHFYFGNLHSHTAYSDGSKDSATTGVNTPREAYFFARQSEHFDFLGISEHNHLQAGMRRYRYPLGRQQADSATVPGQFVALWGMEWGIIAGGGHVLIYGYDELIGWQTGAYDEFVGQNDYHGLWRKLNARPGAFASCAHPGGDDYNDLKGGAFDPSADSALVGSAFRSGPAFSTDVTYSNASTTSYESYFRALLTRGYHIGPFFDHDNHNTTFGRTTAGRLVILADTLTQAALLGALRARHFYASDDWNAQATLTLGQHPMGALVQEPGTPTLAFTLTDADGETTRAITLVRGVAGSGQPAVIVATAAAGALALQYTDTALAFGDSAYYFAEVTQADNDKIITAPIWYRRGPVRVTGTAPILADAVPVTLWPNPVAPGQTLTVAGPVGAALLVRDALGRVVWAAAPAASGTTVVPTGILPAGVYIVQLLLPDGSRPVRRLIVE